MGLFTRRKIMKATEAVRTAHENGLAFRQMLTLMGLTQEASKQSESEKRLAECMEEFFRAIERGNFNDSRSGNGSAAIYALMAVSAAETTASLWKAEELKARVPDEYKGDISNAVGEVSRLFSDAASALNKVLDDLKSM